MRNKAVNLDQSDIAHLNLSVDKTLVIKQSNQGEPELRGYNDGSLNSTQQKFLRQKYLEKQK